jgi:hypothetical protein
MKYLTDAEIDRIAREQDGGEWLTKQLTKLEWRAFARDIEQAAVSAATTRALQIADEAMLVQLRSFAEGPDGAQVIPVHSIDGYEHVVEACEWLGPRGLVQTSGKRPGDSITILQRGKTR